MTLFSPWNTKRDVKQNDNFTIHFHYVEIDAMEIYGAFLFERLSVSHIKSYWFGMHESKIMTELKF